MNRPTVIATVVAAGGVLVAGSVAALALVNAVSSTPADSTSVEVVAAEAAAPAVEVSLPAAESPTELPELVESTKEPAAKPTRESEQPTTQAPSGAIQAEPVVQKNQISANAARKAVSKATPGVVLGISKTNRQGMQAWAVQVERADGSVVTGYVDRSSGVVFDWSMDRKATPTSSANSSTQQSQNNEDDENEHENEHENDHEGEDDDD